MIRAFLLASACFWNASLAWAGFPYSDRYEQWSANRPFPIGAWCLPLGDQARGERQVVLSPAQRIDRYLGAGLNQFIAYKAHRNRSRLQEAVRVGLAWKVVTGSGGTLEQFQNQLTFAASLGDGPDAIELFDEPANSEVPVIVERMQWAKQRFQSGGSKQPLLYANLSALKIDIDQYITQVKPDVLSYDRYPLLLDGSTSSIYFKEMGLVRQKALQHNLPMWMIQQAYSRLHEPGGGELYRLPSESDMRFQAFSFLGHGGLGIDYFIYLGEGYTPAIIDCTTNQPSEVYYSIQDMAPEIEVLGTALKKLRPVGDVEFLGQAVADFDDVIPFQATGSRKLNNIESAESALVSYFNDEKGDEYFMLVNLKHGGEMDKSEAQDSITLFFDSTVLSIQRLNRLTGKVETLSTINNPSGNNRSLVVSLEGGTGDLFKYVKDATSKSISWPIEM
jgi:hypothetical protein